MRISMGDAYYQEVFNDFSADVQIKLVYFGEARYKAGLVSGPHVHGYYEVVIITEGEARYTVGDRTYDLRHGDIYLAKPGELHTLTSLGSSDWAIYAAAMVSIGVPELDQVLRDTSVTCIPGCAELIPPFERIMRAAQQGRMGSMHMTGLLVSAWLIEVAQHLGHSELAGPSHERSMVVLDARAYIEQNARHCLSTAEIAREVGLSRSRLAHRFSEEIGCSIGTYARQVVMQRALRLLEDRHVSVTEIADTLGFPSIYCFSASFKRFWGFSPMEYRDKLSGARQKPNA